MVKRAIRKVAVTGGSGKAGRPVVKRLVDAGYEVVNVDLVPSRDAAAPFVRADLTDFGQAIDVLKGSDAVVHLAAIPAPRMQPDEVTYRVNVTSKYNVFSAAVTLGLKRVVWASSETVLGLPFDRVQPNYAPIDEKSPLYPETTYALSKVVAEQVAAQHSRWSGIPFVGLRFSNVMEPEDYAAFPSYWKDAGIRKWNLWGYVDARDVAQSCQLGLEADVSGAESFIIAAPDTVMDRPSEDLMAEVFPKVPVRRVSRFGTLLSIEKARRILGYEPEHSWRKYVQ